MTRWGIYHGLADKLERGDKLPTGFGENPPKNLLAFALSDEADNVYDPRGHDRFRNHAENWLELLTDNNIDGKIGLMKVAFGGTPGDLLPDGEPIPPFAEQFNPMPRGADRFGNIISGQDVAGFEFLKDAFMTMTNGGTELPDAFGIFVDDSGSVKYEEVEPSVQMLMNWVRTEYGSDIIVPNKNGGKWKDDIYLATDEAWIARSQDAVEQLLADPDFNVLVEDGTLDQSESGVKGLLDPVYTITDFDQEELQMFLEKCTEAISVNAAEQERFQSEYNELAMKDAGLEKYFENAEGLDIPSAMAAYRLSRVQMDINANLMGAVKEMENVLYTDFLE